MILDEHTAYVLGTKSYPANLSYVNLYTGTEKTSQVTGNPCSLFIMI